MLKVVKNQGTTSPVPLVPKRFTLLFMGIKDILN